MQTPEEFVEIIRKIEHKECWDSEDGIIADTDFSIGNKDAVELVRARDAEIRRECAGRAEKWLIERTSTIDPALMATNSGKWLIKLREKQTAELRAAIKGAAHE